MIWSFLLKAIEPVTKLIDELHTSEDERNKVKQAMFAMQNEMAMRVLEYETKLMEAQAKVITAEAQGASWLQRTWRPITMLSFLGLVIADTMGYTEFRLSEEAWVLLQIGLGGYVVGRSAEKVAPRVTEVIKKK